MADERTQFEALYNRYAHLILAYAARRTARYEDAADVLADTFTVVWRRINDVPEGDEARLWIYGVACRTLANHHRSDRRRRRLDERLQHEVARIVAAAHRPRASAEIARISSAFNRLSPTDREVLTLIGWEGLDMARSRGCWAAAAPESTCACTGRARDCCGRWTPTALIHRWNPRRRCHIHGSPRGRPPRSCHHDRTAPASSDRSELFAGGLPEVSINCALPGGRETITDDPVDVDGNDWPELGGPLTPVDPARACAEEWRYQDLDPPDMAAYWNASGKIKVVPADRDVPASWRPYTYEPMAPAVLELQTSLIDYVDGLQSDCFDTEGGRAFAEQELRRLDLENWQVTVRDVAADRAHTDALALCLTSTTRRSRSSLGLTQGPANILSSVGSTGCVARWGAGVTH